MTTPKTTGVQKKLSWYEIAFGEGYPFEMALIVMILLCGLMVGLGAATHLAWLSISEATGARLVSEIGTVTVVGMIIVAIPFLFSDRLQERAKKIAIWVMRMGR